MTLGYPLAEKHSKRKLPRKGEVIDLFILTTDYRIHCMAMVGPLREAGTYKKWQVEDALDAAWNGAIITIRPPTTKELHWAQGELEKMIDESQGRKGKVNG